MAVITTTTLVKIGVKAATTVTKKSLEAIANPEKTGSKVLSLCIALATPLLIVVVLVCGVFSGVSGYVNESMDDFYSSTLYSKIQTANLFYEISAEAYARQQAILTLPIPEEEEEKPDPAANPIEIAGANSDEEEDSELTDAEIDELFALNHITFEIEAPNLAYTLAYISHAEEVGSKWGNVFNLDTENETSPSFLMIIDFYEQICVHRTQTYIDEDGNNCTRYYLGYLSPYEIAQIFWPDDTVTQEMYVVSYEQFCDVYDIPEVIYEMADSRMNIPVYYQTYNYKPFGGGTISSSGCGPTSLAMCLSYLTGTTVSVNNVADWAGNRYYVQGQGQSWNLFPDAAAHWGCQARQAGSTQEVIAALEAGCPVIASMGPGHFTTAGHFIVLCGTTSDGYLIVNDPNLHNYNDYGNTVPADWVWNEAKGYFILSGGQ